MITLYVSISANNQYFSINYIDDIQTEELLPSGIKDTN